MSSLQKLYDSPLETAREFAIVVSGTGAAIRQKDSTTAHDLAFQQVRASVPVYAKCKAEAGRLAIEATTTGDGNTRIYFVPWARTSIYRVRPKAANTTGVTGNLLFTPNLDGCMVTIEGTADNPTVYHSNAAGAPLSGLERAALVKAQAIGEDGTMENLFKISKMKSSLETFIAIPPKNPLPPVVTQPKTGHYDFLEYDKGSKQEMVQNSFGGVDLDQDVHYGAVFGVRKDGAWTFYKQSFQIVRKERDVQKSKFFGLGTSTIEREKSIKYAVASAEKFWP